MFDNIGSKIKGCAKAIFFIEAVSFVISGIATIAEDEDMILVGLLLLIVGPFVSWVSSWLLYGFGELIDNTTYIAGKVANLNSTSAAPSVPNVNRSGYNGYSGTTNYGTASTNAGYTTSNANAGTVTTWTCGYCHSVNNGTSSQCRNCGRYKGSSY